MGESYKIQPSLLKQEMEHDETFEDTWEGKENEWFFYAENDVLSFAFCYVRFTMGTGELTIFGI